MTAGNHLSILSESKASADVFIAQLRQSIFEADDIEHEDVYVKQWGIKIRVVGLTSEKATKLWQDAVDQTTKTVSLANIYPELVIYSCRAILENGETGPHIFTLADKGMLIQRSAKIIESLAKTAMIVSGMREDTTPDLEKAKSETSE